MTATIAIETQGISDDWLTATGDFEVRARGLLGPDQLLGAMRQLALLDTPDTPDPCAPYIATSGPAGDFGFVGQGGSIFCLDTEQELSPRQAADLATGQAIAAPPPPAQTPPRRAKPVVSRSAAPLEKRKFGWRGGIVLFLSLCFLLGAIIMVFGVFSMKSRGMPQSDVMAATTIAGGLGIIAVLMFALALKARRKVYLDDQGRRVSEDGSALPFVVMGQSIGSDDMGVDYDYDDGGADDFD